MRLPLAVLALLLSGCVATHTVAVGPPQPRLPRDCPIRIVRLAPEELFEDYLRVGSVCIVSRGGFGPPEPITNAVRHAGSERDALFGRACALGGEIVAVSGPCSIDRANAVEFAVLRARADEP